MLSTVLSRKGEDMRKKELVHMVNHSANSLSDITGGFIDFIENMGGESIGYDFSNNDRVCFILKGKTIGVSTHAWDVECETVSFPEFLKILINLCSE
jgi:hypothetical protein